MVVLMKKLPLFSYSCLSCSSVLRLILVLAIVSVKTTRGLVKLPPNVTVPAVLAFGDSVVDPGNNNNLKTVVKCNFAPYGRDFEGGISTGRFCNGKVPGDLVAEELGVKEYLPAYLDPNLDPSELPTGVSFASGASGYDPMTPKLLSVLSLSDQTEMLKEYIGKLKGMVGEERTNFILANSVVLLVSGSDDIANTYFGFRLRQFHYDVPAYTDLMVNSASSFLKELYELGLRRFGVFSVPPIGCVPSQRTLGGGLKRECAQKYNDAAKLFNSKLKKKFDSLNRELPDSNFIYIDIYNPLLDVILNCQKYGYKVVDKGCCGTGIIEVSVLCNPLNPVCPNVSEYVFWDSYHPTEGVYKLLVGPLLQKYVRFIVGRRI